MTHNLIDLQIGGISQFRVRNNGILSIGNRVFFNPNSNGVLTITNDSQIDFNRVNFGGTTNSFPSLKRSGAALEVRLADDSGFANFSAREVAASVGFFAPNSTEVRGTYMRGRASTFINFSDGTAGMLIDSASGTVASASAILQADSTTKGFLPPRMTEAQRLAIAGGTPAVGLMVYQTDASDGLYVYKTGGWTLIA